MESIKPVAKWGTHNTEMSQTYKAVQLLNNLITHPFLSRTKVLVTQVGTTVSYTHLTLPTRSLV